MPALVDPVVAGVLIFGIALLLLLIGVPVGAALGIVAIGGFYLIYGNEGLASFVPFKATNNFILTAIPLFIFMGEVLLRSGASDRIYGGAGRALSWAPGGLLHSNIASCALFAAISGSSPVTAATIGTVAIPALEKRGYDRRLTLGSLAAGGTLGILIPPSISLLVYGALAETSIARLFAGGVVPGLLLSSMFMGYIALRVARDRSLAPQEPFSLTGAVLGLGSMWPVAIIMGIVLGGIFGGVFTPTEAAAVGAISALGVALLLRGLTWSSLVDSIKGTVYTTSMIMIIVVGASLMASLLASLGVPRALAQTVVDAGLPSFVVLGLILLLYLILGLFMDGVSAMIMTLPAVLPIVIALGYDLVWFGVILTVVIEVGMLTPPVGINVFVIQGISKRSLGEVLAGTTPFMLIILLGIVLMTAFPDIVLWLPSTMQ